MDIIDDKEVTILDTEGTEVPKSVARSRALDLSVQTDKPVDEIQTNIEAGDSSDANEAKSLISEMFDIRSLEGQEDIQGTYNDYLSKAGDVQDASTFFIEQAMTLNDPSFNAPLARHMVNMSVAKEVFQEELEKAWDDPSTLGLVNDWIDYNIWRYIPVGVFEALTNRTERKGEELLNASTQMGEKEYRAYIKEYVEELKDEGIFESDNFFALSQGFEEVSTLGNDPDQLLKQAFAVFDLGLLKPNTAIRVAKFSQFGPAGKVAAVRGTEAATEVARKLKGAPDAAHGAAVSPADMRLADDPIVNRGVIDGDGASETILGRLNRQYNEGLLLEAPNKEALVELQLEISKTFSEGINRKLVHSNLEPIGFGNYDSVIQVGRVDGAPFKTKSSADKLRAIEGQGAVKEVEGGWIVEMRETLDTSKAISETPVVPSHKNIFSNLYSKTFGAATNRQSEMIRAHSVNAESVSSKISHEIQRDLDEAFKPLNKTELSGLDEVMEELRDGADSYRRTNYTPAEFSAKYKTITGELPKEHTIKAYEKIVEANDAAWTIDAHFYLQQAVRRGQKSIDTGGEWRVMGTPVTKPADGLVYDASTRKPVNVSEVTGEVWRVDDEILGTKYVTNPITTKNPVLEDVLPYNAGGFRNNSYSRYFVGTGDDADFRALLGAFSRKQVDTAVQELGVLSQALRGGLKGKRLDEIIQKNNSWNPSIETVGDLEELRKKTGYDFSKPPSFKERDQKVIGGNSDGATFGQEQRRQQNYNRRRANNVLLTYGGDTSTNLSPTLSIAEQVSKSANRFAHKHYTDAAVVGWVKAAKAKGILDTPSGVSSNDFFRQFMEGKIGGTGVEASVLKNQRAVILRRLNISPTKDSLEGSWEDILASASEAIFDVSRGKIQKDLTKMDGSAQLMKVGFLSKFGFFNPAQFLIQSQQLMSIVAISPKHGGKASALAIPFRAALNAPSASARRLAIKRLGSFMGVKDNFLEEVFDNVLLSGRHILSHDIVELAEGAATSARLGRKRPVGNMLDKSTAFFKEGELLARLTGILTASLEYAAKNPKQSLKTDTARAWISSREQTLTFNMTTANRSAGQSGIMRAPTQWMTFTFRAMEAVAIGGKGLSTAERARLGLALTAVWGVQGITIPYLFDNETLAADLAETLTGSSDNTEAVKTLQYGLIDGMVRWTTGADTALATRLAPLSGLGDFVEKLFSPEADQSFIQTLLGPSGEILGDTASSALKAMGHLAAGAPQIALADAETAYRNISTADNIHKAVGIWKYSTYRTKTGKALDIELDIRDAILQGMGFTSMEVMEYYRLNSHTYNEKNYQDKWFKSHIRPYTRKMRGLIEEGDTKGALEMAKQLDALIQTSGLNKTAQVAMRRRMLNDSPELLSDLMERAFKLGIGQEAAPSYDIIEGN